MIDISRRFQAFIIQNLDYKFKIIVLEDFNIHFKSAKRGRAVRRFVITKYFQSKSPDPKIKRQKNHNLFFLILFLCSICIFISGHKYIRKIN